MGGLNPTGSRWRWLDARGWSTVAGCWLIVFSLITALLLLGSEILEGEALLLDDTVLSAARDVRVLHPWLPEVMRDLSGLGSTLSLVLLTLAVCGYCLLRSSLRAAVFIALTVGAASGAMRLLKWMFGRARPDTEWAQFTASGWSFPSGHTSMSAVVFLVLGSMLARAHGPRREQVYIVGVAALLAILVGMSRAALGLHWASDVLAGWIFGVAWSVASLSLAEHFDGVLPASAASPFRMNAPEATAP